MRVPFDTHCTQSRHSHSHTYIHTEHIYTKTGEHSIDRAHFPIVKMAGSLAQTMKICNRCIILPSRVYRFCSSFLSLSSYIPQILLRMLFLIWFQYTAIALYMYLYYIYIYIYKYNWEFCLSLRWENCGEIHSKNHVFKGTSSVDQIQFRSQLDYRKLWALRWNSINTNDEKENILGKKPEFRTWTFSDWLE